MLNNSLLEEVKKMTVRMCFYVLTLFIVLLITLNFKLDMIYGILFGSIISILNFRLLAISIEKTVSMPPAKANVYAGLQYIIRMSIIVVILLVSVKQPHINIIGTALGLLGPKFIILFNKLIIKKLIRKEAR